MTHNPWSMYCGKRVDGEPFRDGERCPTCEPALSGAQAERDAALADLAAAQGKIAAYEDRMWATVYERTAWNHDLGRHAGSEHPYEFCPRCEMEHPKGEAARLRAEVASLRVRLAAVEALCWDSHEQYVYAADLRAALAPPPPEETT